MRTKYATLSTQLDEKSLRLCAATDAKMLGFGGVSFVAKAAGMSRTTLHRGSAEIKSGQPLAPGRVRLPGGGRKLKSQSDETLLQDLDRLLDPVTRGDPMSPLR